MKQAKIQLSADIKGFNQKIAEAKKNLASIDSVKINGGFAKALREKVEQELADTARSIKQEMNGIEAVLTKATKSMDKGFNATKVQALTNKLSDLEKQYKEVAKAAKEAASAGNGVGGGGSSGAAPEAAGGGGTGGGLLGKIGGRMMAAAAGLAGLSASMSRRMTMAGERLDLRAATGGANLATERSALGYTPSERRQRATAMGAAARGNMSTEALTGVTNLSEQLSRGYGISQGTQAGVIGAGKTMGENNAQKSLMDSFGGAVRAGMEGGNIERYLLAQTGYLEEMSNGVDIDKGSLDGFAAGIADIPFFKNDPNRIFEAIRSMGDAFKNGDRFQQGQAMRAIQASSPGSSIGALELRRSMGLFANTKSLQGSLKGLEGEKGFAGLNSAMGVGGGDILRNQMKEEVNATQGMELGGRIQSIMERAGLQGEGGMSIAAKMIKGEKFSDKDLNAARLSPEEQIKQRLNEQVYTGVEKSVKDLEAMWESMKDVMAATIAEPIAKLAMSIDALAAKLGVDTSKVGGTALAVGGVAATALGLGAGPLLKKGGSLLKGAGGAALSAGRAGLGAAAGLIPGVGGALLNTGVGTLAGGGLAGAGVLAGGALAAGGAGYAAGKYLVNPMLDKYTNETDKYGRNSNIVERSFGKMFMNDQEYEEAYGQGTNKASGGEIGIGAAAPVDQNTIATNENTMALREHSKVMRETKTKIPGYGGQGLAKGKHR